MDQTSMNAAADAAGINPMAGPSTAAQRGRKPKKKAKTGQATKGGLQRHGTLPKPYLALAPSPVSSMSATTIDEMASSSRSNLLLPSSFTPVPPHPNPHDPTTTSGRRVKPIKSKKYAAGLLAPPMIMPGGTSATAKVHQLAPSRIAINPPIPMPGRLGVAGSGEEELRRARSRERLRAISSGPNDSMISLGQVGRMLGNDPDAPATEEPVDLGPVPEQAVQPARRRRRIVRGDSGIQRRLTVSTREEGRALGLARGASMRRVNVWDDLPESSDPPPAFPFQTAANNRQPPAFETSDPAAPASSEPGERPRSPPPSFEQAIGLVPLPLPALAEEVEEEAPPAIVVQPPELQIADTEAAAAMLALTPSVSSNAGPSRSSSPVTSNYESAPQSPATSHYTLADDGEDGDRDDRKMWNADILAGYTLEERVRREAMRRKSRDEDAEQGEHDPQLSVDAPEASVPVKDVGPSEDLQDVKPSRPTINTEAVQPGSLESPLSTPTATLSRKTSTQKSKARRESSSASASSPVTPRAPLSNASTTAIHDVIMGKAQRKASLSPSTTIPPPTDASDLRVSTIAVEQPSLMSAVRSTVPADAVIDQAPPSRRLSRGKAIRRSSSGLKSDSTSIRSRQTSESPKKPLFATPGYTATELQQPVPPTLASSRRTSEPNMTAQHPNEQPSRRSSLARKVSAPQSSVQLVKETEASPVLPPHREAALRRRELALARVLEPIPVEQPSVPTVRQPSNPSGPLIDLNDTLPSISPISPDKNQIALIPSSAWTTELLQLLDEVQSPAAESSAQAVARTAAVEIVKAEVEAVMAQARDNSARSVKSAMSTIHEAASVASGEGDDERGAGPGPSDIDIPKSVATAPMEAATNHEHQADPRKKDRSPARKPAPPPPPSLRLKKSAQRDQTPAKTTRKLSVLSTADSPILPDPRTRPLTSAPVLTLRRPAPLPPLKFEPLAIPGTTARSGDTGSPDQPVDPDAAVRPALLHQASKTSTSSSSSEAAEYVPYVPPPHVRSRTSLSARPRGPRPPPPSSRTWAKVISETLEEHVISPTSPVLDSPVRVQLHDPGPIDPTTGEALARPPPRAASVQDLRSSTARRSRRGTAGRQMSYTDLDVLVSRLEGSGREFEGFSQITSFLGPAKSTAATPAQLATLLPGPISVESKRTTAQGKVKLKLSLLGVRVSKCPICLSQFKDKDKAVMLPECGHVAHQTCGTRWFRDDSRCFVCRAELKDAE